MELNYAIIEDFFREGQNFASLVDDYKYRPTQVELADYINKSFENKEFLVAEAGTGVGKTYAYLLPAIVWAANEKEKVIISTKTKALQQQLMEKDLPNILQALNINIKYAEAKGRDNYLCWNKYAKIIAGRKVLSAGEIDFIDKVTLWVEKTPSGDRKELDLKSDLMSHWGIVAADRKSCLKDACRYHDKCFRLKMIQSLGKSDIIITNHALLLSDIMVDNTILPAYKYLIIDEAHNLDREAFARLSNKVIFSDFNDILKSLYNKGQNRGHLIRLKGEMPLEKLLIDECIILITSLEQSLFEWQNSIKTFLGNKPAEQLNSIVTKELTENAKFNLVFDKYSMVIGHLNNLIMKFDSLKNEDDEDFLQLKFSLKELSDLLFVIMEEDLYNNSSLVWVEWQDDKIQAIASSVIQVGQVLHESLYNKLDSLIMLSATITVDEKFDFFINKTGLNEIKRENRLNTYLGASPFSYDEQAKMLVLNDLPLPNVNPAVFIGAVAPVLKEIILLTKGRTLILFTSRKEMKLCAEELRPLAQKNNTELLVQNEDGEAISVINAFINNKNSILMGLDSFWEGIDLKGDLLTCLVIVKLPFKSPNDPLSSANDKYCRNNGINSFATFALPDAIMRFKQGVGRLIRSETDQGVVIVLDNRLYASKYGQSFRNSIPIKNVHNLNSAAIKSFL